jgi:hypothetical protein
MRKAADRSQNGIWDALRQFGASSASLPPTTVCVPAPDLLFWGFGSPPHAKALVGECPNPARIRRAYANAIWDPLH